MLRSVELLFTGTLAAAQALDLDGRIGNFDLGKDADLVLVDASGWEPLAVRWSMQVGRRTNEPPPTRPSSHC